MSWGRGPRGARTATGRANVAYALPGAQGFITLAPGGTQNISHVGASDNWATGKPLAPSLTDKGRNGMKQGSVGMRPHRRWLAIAISLLFAGTMGAAYAADVQINTPPGGNFVVKDNAGVNTLLKADGSGPVTVPNLL